MKNISTIVLAIIIFPIILFSPGCMSKTYFHTYSPISETVETSLFKISVEPIKRESNFFSLFKVSIENKSSSSLEIDWNKSRYLHNRIDRGVFVFKDIDPSSVKNSKVPNSIIPPDANFSLDIAPFSKISLGKIKDKEDGRLKAGMLPEGENSVLLVLNHNGQVIKKVFSIIIKEEVK